MAERLTEIGMFINNPTYKIKQGKKGEAVDKLAKLEDVLEKYGIESVEELDGVLKPLIENGEFDNWKSAEFWKIQTQKQQSRWKSLKEFILDSDIEFTIHGTTSVESAILEKMEDLEGAKE